MDLHRWLSIAAGHYGRKYIMSLLGVLKGDDRRGSAVPLQLPTPQTGEGKAAIVAVAATLPFSYTSKINSCQNISITSAIFSPTKIKACTATGFQEH